jgi:hypothetical protein
MRYASPFLVIVYATYLLCDTNEMMDDGQFVARSRRFAHEVKPVMTFSLAHSKTAQSHC